MLKKALWSFPIGKDQSAFFSIRGYGGIGRRYGLKIR